VKISTQAMKFENKKKPSTGAGKKSLTLKPELCRLGHKRSAKFRRSFDL